MTNNLKKNKKQKDKENDRLHFIFWSLSIKVITLVCADIHMMHLALNVALIICSNRFL